MQNLEARELCKHRIAIAGKNVTGQYGSSIQFYSRWMISKISSVSGLTVGGVVPKPGTGFRGRKNITSGWLDDYRGTQVILTAVKTVDLTGRLDGLRVSHRLKWQ